ncbi:serine/threonine protein kinase [Nannocystis pusilla]|uniref:Protein kinase domain-containing protein n=1 Tax=Nannocystis pusilla TaxID=889268 RepID=A0ABS7TMT2_9BACT|nr:hypothetical protein [Nannocystis pusilla]MBZ5709396.1 hypothetical protein [Nannocystis pusilla]
MSEAFSPRVGDNVADRFELKVLLRHSGATWGFAALDRQTGGESTLILFDPDCAHSSAWSAFARLIGVATAAKIPGLVLPQGVSSTRPNPPWCVSAPHVGRDLERLRAQDGSLPWRRALILGERILEILSNTYAATQVAHRALAPSRCIVSARDEVQVLDYGVAEIELGEAPSDDIGYRAPEQQHGPGDSRSDIYTVAAILFELISGKHPSTTELPQLRLLVPVPFNVNILLAKALAQDPEHRYVDHHAMRAAMREALGLAPVPRPEPAKTGPTPDRLPASNPQGTHAKSIPVSHGPARSPGDAQPAGEPPPTSSTPQAGVGARVSARSLTSPPPEESTLRLPEAEPARPGPIRATALPAKSTSASGREPRAQMPVLADVTLELPPASNGGAVGRGRDDSPAERTEPLERTPSQPRADKTETLVRAPLLREDQKTDALDERTQVLTRRLPLRSSIEKAEVLHPPVPDERTQVLTRRSPVHPSIERTEALRAPVDPPGERTEVLGPPVRRSADKIEVLGRPAEPPADKTEALPRIASGTTQDTTLALPQAIFSPRIVQSAPPDDITLAFERPQGAPLLSADLQVQQDSAPPKLSRVLVTVSIALVSLVLLVIVCNLTK